MDRLVQGIRRGALLPLLLALCASGCVTTGVSFWGAASSDDERPCQILSYWEQRVRVALDTKTHTIPPKELPMLAGRVYFMGAGDKGPIAPRGTLIVDFYDMSTPSDTQPPLLGRTVYDPDSLQRMRSVNMLGMGYTILADWQTYSPKYKRIKVHLTFIPEKGGDPVLGEPAIVSLQGASVEMSRRIDIPGLNSGPVGPPDAFVPPPPTPLKR